MPAQRLLRRLIALSEPLQREAILSEAAAELGPELFTEVISMIVSTGADGTPGHQGDDFQVALAAAVYFLSSDRFDDELRVVMLRKARDEGHRELLRLLVAPRAKRSDNEVRVPDYGRGRALTLGERKSLARKPSRELLDRVLADPHSAVIHNLLRNPRLTEGDVLRLASRRPIPEEVLCEVYRNTKWIARYPIKVALVRNPYTPPTIGLKLIPLLLRQDLKQISNDLELHQSIIVAAKGRLETPSRP